MMATGRTAVAAQIDSFGGRYSWAYAHKLRGKWGQLTPPGKIDEKLKSENMQKRAVLYVYTIF